MKLRRRAEAKRKEAPPPHPVHGRDPGILPSGQFFSNADNMDIGMVT